MKTRTKARDKIFTDELIARGAAIQDKAIALEAEILGLVNERIGV